MHEAASRALFEEAVKHLTAELCALRGWVLHSTSFPVIDMIFTAEGRQTARFRAHFDDWNSTPPSIVWLDAQGNLAAAIPQAPGGQFQQSHPNGGRPFVCMPGIREYHAHPNHLNDRWDNYKERSGYDLGGIITQVWRAWQAAKP